MFKLSITANYKLVDGIYTPFCFLILLFFANLSIFTLSLSLEWNDFYEGIYFCKTEQGKME